MAADHPTADGARGFGLWMFPGYPADTLADMVVAAEAAGLDELWLGDEGPARDPLVILAAAAHRTQRIRLGVAVTNPYLRHPASTASAFATLAELAPGRVVLGLGSGGGLALGPVGLEREEPLRRVTDAVRVMPCRAAGRGHAGLPPAHARASGPRRADLHRRPRRAAQPPGLGGGRRRVPGRRRPPHARDHDRLGRVAAGRWPSRSTRTWPSRPTRSS